MNPGIDLPRVEFASSKDVLEGISGFEVSDAPDVSEPDVVQESFSNPVTERVDRVEMDYDSGRIQVFRQDGSRSEYALAAWDSDERFSLVDSEGLLSTSEKMRTSEPEYAAIVDTLRSITGEGDRSRAEAEFGLQSPTDMYEEVLKEGSYEVPEGDCVFRGFDSVEGHRMLASDAKTAQGFFDYLDSIAEFLVEDEEEYNTSDDYTFDDLSLVRDGGDYYKFRVPDTGDDVSIVIDKDYRELGDKIEVYVRELADHDSDVMNLY